MKEKVTVLLVMLREYLSGLSIPPLSDGGFQLTVAENGVISLTATPCGILAGAKK